MDLKCNYLCIMKILYLKIMFYIISNKYYLNNICNLESNLNIIDIFYYQPYHPYKSFLLQKKNDNFYINKNQNNSTIRIK